MDEKALNDSDQGADAGWEIGDERRMHAGIGHAAMIGPSTWIGQRISRKSHLSLIGMISNRQPRLVAKPQDFATLQWERAGGNVCGSLVARHLR